MKKAVCPIGIVETDENGKFINIERFSGGAKDVAEKILNFPAEENIASVYIRNNLRSLGKISNSELRDIGIELVKLQISGIVRKDRLIIQATSAINDLDKILNLMSERLEEWYGLHYPEFSAGHEKFAEEVSAGIEKDESIGMKLDEKDMEILKKYAENLRELYKLRKDLEKYIDSACEKECPNLKALLGGLLAGRLLVLAGGLERLAKMASSKIQIIGSEKSMFKFMKEKRKGSETAKCPKFGILFTHPDVCSAQREKQGKIARLLAAKVMIAARTDFYSKENKSKEILEDYKKKLGEVK